MLENHMVIGDYYQEDNDELECGCFKKCYCNDDDGMSQYYHEKYGDPL